MPEEPTLFDGDEHHPLVGALAGIERAITTNTNAIAENTRALTDHTRAIDELADAVRGVLNSRAGTTEPSSSSQTGHADPDAEADRTSTEADTDGDGERTAADADSTGPEQPDTEPDRDDTRPVIAERTPVERPARFAELAGYESAAVVGPGFVQIGAHRWAREVHSAAEVVRIAERLKHSRSAPQIWILTETCEELGLVTYPDDVNSTRRERITSTEVNLAELPAGQTFLAPAFEAGWDAGRNGQLEAWTLLRGPSNKIAHVILEPYTWMYDHDGRGVIADGGDDDREYPNAITGTPEERADEILCRVRWIDEHLSVLPDSNPGRTMQRVIDADRRTKLKTASNDRSTKTDASGRNRVRVATEPGTKPDMDGDAELSLDAVAPELIWPRIPSREEIDTAEVAIELDQRYAYLSTLSNTAYGLGEPRWVSAEEAVWTASQSKNWFGVLRCEPRTTWHEPRMFPPHPGLAGRPGPHWIMGPSIDIARDDEDKGGGGWTFEDLGVTGGYLWPDAGRLMEPFYTELRPALIAAEQIEDPALRAATIEHLKGGYKSLTGKWEDIQILNSGHRTYRYQPMWRRQTIAATSARLFRQVRRLEQRHRGLWPVHAVTDGVWYLVSRATAEALTAETAEAKFGQLRPKTVHTLTDDDRAALHKMTPEDKIISVPHALNLGTDTKGR